MAQVTFDSLRKAVVALINADDTLAYAVASNDEKYHDSLVQDACRYALAKVAFAVASNPTHPDRLFFLKRSTDLDHETDLRTAGITDLGPVIAIQVAFGNSPYDYELAKIDDTDAIRRYRRLRTAGRLTVSMYSATVAETTLYHTGTKGRVIYIPSDIAESTSSITGIPEHYLGVCIDLALAELWKWMGADAGMQASAACEQSAMVELQMIETGKVPVTPPNLTYQGS